MSLTSDILGNLSNGVSQQTPRLRFRSQAEVQINAYSSLVEGLIKRPASVHVARLVSLDGTPKEELVVGPYDVGVSFQDGPQPGELMLVHVFDRTVKFAVDFAQSRAVALVAPTTQRIIDVRKNGSSIGSVTFAAAATSGTFTTSPATENTFLPGDNLQLVAPTPDDVTFADISVTFYGERL